MLGAITSPLASLSNGFDIRPGAGLPDLEAEAYVSEVEDEEGQNEIVRLRPGRGRVILLGVGFGRKTLCTSWD